MKIKRLLYIIMAITPLCSLAGQPPYRELADSCFTYFFTNDTLNFNRLYPRMVDAYEQQADPATYHMRRQLLALREEDQGIRLLLLEARRRYGGTSSEAQAIHARMKQIDRTNARLVQQMLDTNGAWPAKEDIGEDASESIFLCIQHIDDLTVQEKYLPMLLQAVETGDAEGWHYAFLVDRIRMNSGKKQVYGTQTITHSNGELNYVVPLENPDRVDSLRQQVGLEPMNIYLDGKWDLETYKRDLPAIELKYKAFTHSGKITK